MLFPRSQRNTAFAIALLATLAVPKVSFSANNSPVPAVLTESWRFADIADLFGSAPIVLRAKIVTAIPIKGLALDPGTVRYLIEGDVVTLIRGAKAVSPRLRWLVDIKPDSRGKIPKLKKADVLIAAIAVPGRPAEIQLAAGDAQVFWTAAFETRLRDVIESTAAPDAPPAITGVVSAFHSAGTVPGEGETQIFLSTVTRAPVSLTILTRPNQPRRWALALSEIVDEAAAPPATDTLAWYRLACFLPRTLPDAATAALAPADADAARSDYDFVMNELVTCSRVRG